jgi:lauroyl/myristoyl acyltransferase
MIRPEEREGRDDVIHWITQEYTGAVEQFVCETPEQYLWVNPQLEPRPAAKIPPKVPFRAKGASAGLAGPR